MSTSCVCESVVVEKRYGHGESMIDPFATTDRLLARVESGEMLLLRADCPLERTNALFESDTRYTLNHYLRCQACGRTVYYGLCIRGLPIYRHVDADTPASRVWERSETFVDHLGTPVQWYQPARAAGNEQRA